jgi:glycosyltransferase involved in cell wall biosynthesis
VPRVEVLISTHNPDPSFLDALLASLDAQVGVSVNVRIRDDGSDRGAQQHLREIVGHRPGTTLELGCRLGPAESFLELLDAADPTAEVVAFCDQDDVWFDTKLASATDALAGREATATLYCSRLIVTDHRLAPLRPSPLPTRGPSFGNALVENIAPGATIVLNQAAVALLQHRRPKRYMMHDAWAYLVVAGCGDVVYDPAPQLYYRQHSANVIGVYDSRWTEVRDRVRRQLRAGGERALTSQAEELRRLYYDDLRPDAQATLDRFLDHRETLSSRLRYPRHPGVHRQSRREDWVVRILYVLGRL